MFLDMVVLFLIAVFFVLGAMDGFIVSVFYLAAWVFGILSVWLFSRTLGTMLSANIEGLESLLALILGGFLAFLIPFFLIRIAAVIAKYFYKRSSALTLLNRILGGAFGVLKGIAVSAVILTVVHLLPAKGSLEQTKKSSTAYSIYSAVSFANLWKDFKAAGEEFGGKVK